MSSIMAVKNMKNNMEKKVVATTVMATTDLECITVYCHRNTIEPYYHGDAYVSKLLVEKEFLERFIKDNDPSEYLQHWLDYYTFEDTKDLYDKAVGANVLHEVFFMKPKVIDNLNIRGTSELAYNAVRMLEIIGKSRMANDLEEKLANADMIHDYRASLKYIRQHIDIEIDSGAVINILGDCLYAKFGKDNPLEIILIPENEEIADKVKNDVCDAYNEWIDAVVNDEEIGQTPLVDYIEEYIKQSGMKCQIFIKKGTVVERE